MYDFLVALLYFISVSDGFGSLRYLRAGANLVIYPFIWMH